MRWRLIVLGCLAVVLGVTCALTASVSTDLSFRAMEIYGDSQQNQPTIAQLDESTRMSQQAWGLALLMTPLAAGSLTSALAIPAVLGRRWQLRDAAARGARRVARQSEATRTISDAGST